MLTREVPFSTVVRSDYGTLVQSASNIGNGATVVITLGAAPTVGDVLILELMGGGTAWVQPTLAQTGVTWTKLVQSTNGVVADCEIWKGVVAAGASATLTLTKPSGTYYYGGTLSQWRGITGTLISSVSGVAASGSSYVGCNPSSIVPNVNCLALLIGIIAGGTGASMQAAGPYVMTSNNNFYWIGYANGPLVGAPLPSLIVGGNSAFASTALLALIT